MKQKNLPNAGACRILTQTRRGDNHTATPVRAEEFLWPQRLTCIPSSSLLMHQKLSASMLRKTSWDRFVTSKFSTSSSAKQRGKSIREMRDNPRDFIRPKLCSRHCNTPCVLGVCLAQSQHPCTHLSPPELKTPKRLAGHALNPSQLPREPGRDPTALLPSFWDKGYAGTKIWHHGTPSAKAPLPWGTAGAPQGELGEGKSSLQPETRRGNTAYGLGQHRELPAPAPSWIHQHHPRNKAQQRLPALRTHEEELPKLQEPH